MLRVGGPQETTVPYPQASLEGFDLKSLIKMKEIAEFAFKVMFQETQDGLSQILAAQKYIDALEQAITKQRDRIFNHI